MSRTLLHLLPALLVASTLATSALASQPVQGAAIAAPADGDALAAPLASELRPDDGLVVVDEPGRRTMVNETGTDLEVVWFRHGRQLHVARHVAAGAATSTDEVPPRFWLGEDEPERRDVLVAELVAAGVPVDEARAAIARWRDALGPVPTWDVLAIRADDQRVEVLIH